jgi:hypothetical protein
MTFTQFEVTDWRRFLKSPLPPTEQEREEERQEALGLSNGRTYTSSPVALYPILFSSFLYTQRYFPEASSEQGRSITLDPTEPSSMDESTTLTASDDLLSRTVSSTADLSYLEGAQSPFVREIRTILPEFNTLLARSISSTERETQTSTLPFIGSLLAEDDSLPHLEETSPSLDLLESKETKKAEVALLIKLKQMFEAHLAIVNNPSLNEAYHNIPRTEKRAKKIQHLFEIIMQSNLGLFQIINALERR